MAAEMAAVAAAGLVGAREQAAEESEAPCPMCMRQWTATWHKSESAGSRRQVPHALQHFFVFCQSERA